jgi:2-polyprenyl-3-methyl-5-hydroxy-6-metoxy-1,4-benzoquinol methylase
MSQYKDYSYSDNLATHAHQYLTQPIFQLLANNAPGNILDLGCGNGALVNLLLDEGFEAYGTDASEQGITIAKKRHANRFALQNLDHEGLPDSLTSLSFNTIISTEVIEHLYDPRAFIDFCKKILIKNPDGGQIILSTPYHGYLKNLSLAIAGKWDSHANPLWDGGHIKLWSRETLGKLLQEKGFVVTDFIGCGRIPYLWKSMVICARLKK